MSGHGEKPDQRDFVQSLERGLKVILAFADGHARLTLSEAAAATGLSRPTTRRLLLTLQWLGYVRAEGRYFSLTPSVLALGYAYVNSLDLTRIAQPVMERVAAEAHMTCTLSTLDGDEIVYIARVPARRLTSIALGVGTRLPAHASAMGQVLLADLAPAELQRYFGSAELTAFTEQTLTTPEALAQRLEVVRAQGWALVDQELEEGLRSLAVPVRGVDGRVFASLGLSSMASPATALADEQLVLAREGAAQIAEGLGGDRFGSSGA